MLILAALLVLNAPLRQAQESPCPDIMTYKGNSLIEPGRWYAKITFPPGSSWQFMNIVLDSKAELLGTWPGKVSTQDYIDYRIDSSETKSSRTSLRFFVKHNPEKTPPRVQVIKLDGREICNAATPDTTTKPKSTLRLRLKAGSVEDDEGIDTTTVATTTTTTIAPITTSHTDFREPINSYSEPHQCGTVKLNNPHATALVVDGSPTQEGQWPWQIALYRTERVNHHYICGGTLVSHRHVITAAHCTTTKGSRPAQKVPENTLTVYLGKHDLVTSIVGVQIRFVEKITVHPDYDTRNYSRDVSVLLLQQPVQYTSWVQPACLWPDSLADLSNVIGKKGSVVGWGNDGSGKLTLVEMPVVSQETCLRSKTDFYSSVTSDFTFCAGQRMGPSACNGDSGGGMVFRINNTWFLRGLVSVAPAKENENVCDPQHYVVFTDLAKLLPWIRQHIEPY